MNWEKLISTTRIGIEDTHKKIKEVFQKEADPRSPYLIDVDRVIYSSHFRKLQDKTQVHPLSKSDYIRTRLTHSLEASVVGRSLGYHVGQKIINKYGLTNITQDDFGFLLQAACLTHDIGNPPFGHLSEEVIKNFFLEKKDYLLSYMSPDEFLSLVHFDGNAQGFRIITKLAGWANEGGLRLTSAALGGFLKYPCGDPTAPKDIIGASKIGVFFGELDILNNIAHELEMTPIKNTKNSFYRHPLAFLVEAADDICYCIADIEDSFFVGITLFSEAEELLAPIARSPLKYPQSAKERTQELKKATFYKKMSTQQKIEFLRGKAIGNLIESVADIFLQYEADILEGAFNHELLSLTIYQEEIKKCKEYAQKRIFKSHDKISSELAGMCALENVLEELYNLIVKPSPKSRRIANYLHLDNNSHLSLFEQISLIIDVISGFTDRNLINFYKDIKGI